MSTITAYTVSSETDLRNALHDIDLSTASNTAFSITFAGNITLTQDLWAIDLTNGNSLTIDGANHSLNGQDSFRGLFAYAGAITIENLAIDHTKAQGGQGGASDNAGGGGGAGLGGGLFVASPEPP